MKILFSTMIAAGLLFTLTGCGNEDSSKASIDSISAETSMEVSNSATQGQSIFNGEIESISEPDDSTIQIKVINVKEIKDPENIGSSFTNDGVILNASEEQLKDGKEAFEKGDQIEIVLVENSIITMSIPPQIPGNSIVEIARIEE
ncbi:LptM family lipoprotein [Enterococcus durans]|uniref:LptM family lipoprotein n=1 Tax=Enterococcus durans TaxID=53345 RepID=UPI0035E0B4CA